MIEVGIRELKNSLSHYVQRIRGGESILVTDRGVPVAQMIPASPSEKMRTLMAERRVTWSGSKFRPAEARPKPNQGPPISSYIAEDRL